MSVALTPITSLATAQDTRNPLPRNAHLRASRLCECQLGTRKRGNQNGAHVSLLYIFMKHKWKSHPPMVTSIVFSDVIAIFARHHLLSLLDKYSTMRHPSVPHVTQDLLNVHPDLEEHHFENAIGERTKLPVEHFDSNRQSHLSGVDQWLNSQAIFDFALAPSGTGASEARQEEITPEKVNKTPFANDPSFFPDGDF